MHIWSPSNQKKTLTLTKVILSKTGKWRVIEVRSSCTPTCWELRGHWKPLFEMLATIYLELLEQQSLDKIIMEEVCGLRVLSSQSVADHFLNTNVIFIVHLESELIRKIFCLLL